jgi:hypothetical protein
MQSGLSVILSERSEPKDLFSFRRDSSTALAALVPLRMTSGKQPSLNMTAFAVDYFGRCTLRNDG